MTDDFEIRSGGAIAVDTDTLRTTAARFELSADVDLADVSRRLLQAYHIVLGEVGHGEAGAAMSTLWDQLSAAKDRADEIATSLRDAALIYELAELNAAYDATGLFDLEERKRIDALRQALLDEDPAAFWDALWLALGRVVEWPGVLVREWTRGGLELGSHLGPEGGVAFGVGGGLGALALAILAGNLGAGTISRGERLSGDPRPVEVRALSGSAAGTPATAPASLSAAVSRVPGGGDARVVAEEYTMPDGSTEWMVYVAGMQDPGFGGADPWNGQSSAELYFGVESASYTATVEALKAAGVEPGDPVHLVGFSHGGMVTSRLAMEGEFNVQTVLNVGSPVVAELDSSTLSVNVRHTDDMVPTLAGGGFDQVTGSSGSFIVEATARAGPGPNQPPAVHSLDAYASTLERAEASGDPRVAQANTLFDRLATAESVKTTEFAAERVDETALSPSSSAAAG